MPANPGLRQLIVVGHGMVGHRLLEELVALGAHERWRITVFGEEPVLAYDRVRLSAVFDGVAPSELSMVEPGFAESHGIEVLTGDAVVSIDRDAGLVTTETGRAQRFDHLVLATGSSPFVPPIPGHDRPGTFVYRTLDDLTAIRVHATQPWVRSGVVIGGGLLGLESANALRLLGLETHVVEMAPRLMPVQLDDGGVGRAPAPRSRPSGSTSTRASRPPRSSPGTTRVAACTLEREDGEPIAADIVVFSAGIRPRDQLAREAGCAVAERGGVVVDAQLATDDPRRVGGGRGCRRARR